MSAVIDKVQAAFTTPSHDLPQVWHRKKILLGVSSAAPQMPDHRSGYFWAELLHPYQVFTTNGWDVDIVSETGSATVDESSVGKMGAATDIKYWEDKKYHLHTKLAEMRPASQISSVDAYTAIYFAGGHACCVDFPNASGLQSLAARIYEAGGVVGADCHGPAIFQNLKLSNGMNILHGKEATGFSTKAEESQPGVMDWIKKNGYHTMQEVVSMAGGKWSEAKTNPMSEYTITSDRVVTGMNPASAKAVAESMLKFLPQDKEFEPVKSSGVLSGLGLQDKDRIPAENVEKSRTYQGERTTV